MGLFAIQNIKKNVLHKGIPCVPREEFFNYRGTPGLLRLEA